VAFVVLGVEDLDKLLSVSNISSGASECSMVARTFSCLASLSSSSFGSNSFEMTNGTGTIRLGRSPAPFLPG
jgi:hypothetical protein